MDKKISTANKISSYRENYERERQINGLARDKFDLMRLVVVLGSRCSLRCRDCNNLIPYFKKPTDLRIKTIAKSVRHILDVVDEINRFELIGGEPFLVKELKDILIFSIAQKKIKKIEITTNGTIFPDFKLLKILRNDKINVEISDYRDKVNSSALVDFLQKNDIKYKILKIDYWNASGGIKKRNRNSNYLELQYKKCISSYYCKTLYEDNIFQCARASSLFGLGVCTDSDSYLKIDSCLTRKNLFNFIFSGVNPACDFCDLGTPDEKKIEPAIQIKGEKT